MIFKTYYSQLSPEGKADLARKLGTSKVYLSQLATGTRRPSRDYCIRIEEATDGIVTRAEAMFGEEAAA